MKATRMRIEIDEEDKIEREIVWGKEKIECLINILPFLKEKDL